MEKKILILQRVIPHYRVPFFSRLHSEFGVLVATADRPPSSYLSLADPKDLKFCVPFPFEFPDVRDAFKVNIPTKLLLDELRPWLVVAEFGMRMSSTYSLPIHRRTGALHRLAFWTHGWQMERGFTSLSDFTIQASVLALFATADAVATYSEAGSSYVKSKLPWAKVIPLGNALDTTPMAKAAFQSKARRDGSPQFLAVGRLTKDKQFDRLISIFSLLASRYPYSRLTIVGDGPEFSSLQELGDIAAPGKIIFTGAIYSEQLLAPHYLGADLVIVPGAAGLSVNHALAYGVPVAAFARSNQGPRHHPEIEYLVPGASGILVSPFTDAAFASAVIQALEGGELTRLRNQISNATTAPTLDQMVRKFSDLLAVL